ncbi:IclR family transcriptional regulator [Micromonospora carbonacea]|uniref:IclR family transcriptional regulator n=1 Tax=Micromonospora carbonacea TaxID=47853 RepID=A0A7H8XMT2_9ACTN|nr:IclR family transcriptional regulator [Micromonospora carbonacea]MBB5826317.1 IclR family acetate operon transcriptional repressor [Micromonospora carbonacea]QLD25858.1 IclR family transcriptional regulator [Micromonospora carbonacea]
MQPVVRALQVLQALSSRPDGMTLQELHLALDIPLGSMHRILAVLREQRFVSRSPIDLRYFLGPAVRDLTERNVSGAGGMQSLTTVVRELSQATGETVFLTELHGSEAVCVSLVEGTYPLRLFVRLGQVMPLNAAAAARVLLAHLPTAVAAELLGASVLGEFTPASPHTAESVLERLPVIRERGYDIAADELDEGVWAVAAPVFTSTGRATASVTLAGSSGRFATEAARSAAIRSVTGAAARMSAHLGWTPGE